MESSSVVFDRYRLEERIGAGGMGVVWKATDLTLDQPVALKRVSLAGVDAEQAELIRARALREARTAARLRHHPHVVATYDVRVDDGDVWLVMEYLPARSLGELICEQGRPDLIEVAHIGARVADALAAGHALGIVHRDVTPGNVLIAANGTVKLTDFGISRPAGQDQITQDGVISGTIAYLAPEVAATGEATPASDVFSLGSTLYAVIEGQPPFGTDHNTFRLLNVVRTGIIRPPTAAGSLSSLLLRLLELDPTTRPDAGTARDLLDQFAHRMTTATQSLPPGEHPARGGTTRPPPHERPPPTAPAARWPRRHPVLTAVLALIILAAACLGTAFGLRSATAPRAEQEHGPLVGTPPLPATVGPISLTGDPKAADPCPLIDPAWLRQFGTPRMLIPLYPSSCRAMIATSEGVPVWLGVTFDTPSGSAGSHGAAGSYPQRVGELTIARQREGNNRTSYCNNVLILADRTQVGIVAYGGEGGTRFNLCTLTEVGTGTAVVALAHHGITYRPGRTSSWPITNNDACVLLTNAELSTIGGTDPTIRDPGYANWSCSWGPPGATVSLAFRLGDARLAAIHGDSTIIAGRRAWLDPTTHDHPRKCNAVVVSRPAASAADATELIEVTIAKALPDQELCTHAADLAIAALNRLPDT